MSVSLNPGVVSATLPVLVTVKRKRGSVPAITDGPGAAFASSQLTPPSIETSLTTWMAGALPKYEASSLSVTSVPPEVPVAVAVFVCRPASAGMGPTTHVAMWLSLAATGTGSVAGQTHAEVSTSGSDTLTGLSGTSPMFSTTRR